MYGDKGDSCDDTCDDFPRFECSSSKQSTINSNELVRDASLQSGIYL